MVRFLSPEWIDALARAASEDDALRHTTSGVRLTIQQRVTAPDGEVSYHVDVDDGRVGVRHGVADRADVTFVQDRDTAVAVASGQLSAQAAFMRGRLRVSGDTNMLVRHADALAGLDGALASVRAETTY